MSKPSAKNKILETAVDCFSAQGYQATSIDDIIRGAGVSKGSFYHSFKSKEVLGLEVLDAYYQRGLGLLAEGAYLQIDDPVERVIGFLQHTEENASNFWNHGCMMGTFAVDLARNHPSFQTKLRAIFTDMEARLTVIFEPFCNALGDDCPPVHKLTRQYLNSLYGAIVMGQALGDPSETADGIRLFRDYLNGLAERCGRH